MLILVGEEVEELCWLRQHEIAMELWKNNERVGAEEISQFLCGVELNGRCTLYAFQSLVPTGIALQNTAVEEGIVAYLIFWGDVVLTRDVQKLLRTGGWSSPEGCLSLVSEAMDLHTVGAVL